jgi:hypothetical protein
MGEPLDSILDKQIFKVSKMLGAAIIGQSVTLTKNFGRDLSNSPKY